MKKLLEKASHERFLFQFRLLVFICIVNIANIIFTPHSWSSIIVGSIFLGSWLHITYSELSRALQKSNLRFSDIRETKIFAKRTPYEKYLQSIIKYNSFANVNPNWATRNLKNYYLSSKGFDRMCPLVRVLFRCDCEYAHLKLVLVEHVTVMGTKFAYDSNRHYSLKKYSKRIPKRKIAKKVITFQKIREPIPSYLFSSLRENNWYNLGSIFKYGRVGNYMCNNGTDYSCAIIMPLAQMPRILKKIKLLQPYTKEIESLHKRMTKNVQTRDIRYTLNV